MASPSSSHRPSPPPLPRSPLFAPIPEMDEGEAEDPEPGPASEKTRHHLSPASAPERSKDERQLSVLFNKCRPSSRDKHNSVVPLDNNHHHGVGFGFGSSPINPKALIHSLLLSLTRKSPRAAPDAASASTSAPPAPDAAEWRLAAQELSRKLLHVTRRRDEAILESSRLKTSVAELERKLDRLESYCLDLKSALDRAVVAPPPADPIPSAVADARSAVRALARALSAHVRSARIASLLKIPVTNTGTLMVYMESLLNRVFYEDFEKPTAEEARILDPAVRCDVNRAGLEAVRGLTWDEVLSKGTKHYSEGLSKFCDKKMGEIVGLMGWARAWPEGLLQAFFGAAKGVWVVYLLSRCVHPAVPVLRVERGAAFDGRYMEDVVVGESGRRGVITPVSVRMMVLPGFYLHAGGVVKCRVVSGYGSDVGRGENIGGRFKN